jgi:16S rRNA (guanine527-N7)-methyltransferase
MTSPKLAAFLDLFEKWNRRINLSAASTRVELEEHLEDSLHVVPVLDGHSRVLDVGSGGGFPVVVAAISLPASHFVAIEPVHKKHAFLRTVARELGLSNLKPLAERLEDHAEVGYDAAMSRATFDLAEWFELGRRMVRVGGLIVGFEAQPRAEIPGERLRYDLRGKSRSLVLQRST